MIWDVDIAVKHRVWNHFIERWAIEKLGGGHGVTGSRLRFIKPYIFKDSNFWLDIVHRHGLDCEMPEALQVRDRAIYDHALGNFWGMIYQDLVKRGKIKS